MSSTPLTPCDGLTLEARAQRLARYLWQNSDFSRETGRVLRDPDQPHKAGICQVCHTSLAVAYRVSRLDPETGQFISHEVVAGSETEKVMWEKIKSGEILWGPPFEPERWHVYRVTACMSLDENCHSAAKAYNDERGRAIREAARDKKRGTSDPKRMAAVQSAIGSERPF